MKNPRELLDYFIKINAVSNDRALSFDQKLQEILNGILNCLQVKSGSIMIRKGRKLLEVRAASNPSLIGVQQGLDQDSISSWVALNKKPVFVSDLDRDDRFPKKFGRYEKHALLSVPVINHGRTIGVLNVTDKVDHDTFSPEEQKILFDLAGQVIGMLEQQKLMNVLQKKEKTLQERNRMLKKGEKLKTDLFNMLIHDLKGPISEVVANLDILSYTIDGPNKDFVESAQSGCYTLVRMVGNLLDIAKFEEGKLSLLYEKTDPKGLIKESIARLFGLAKIKSLTFFEDFAANGGDDELWIDRGLLLRVLQNLMSNAIEYSPEAGIIKMGYSFPKKGTIEFYVEDQGPGIAPEYHQKIFDKYTQLDKKSDGRIYTTGLGLTFCRVAVKAHKGRIGILSEIGKGSRFYFTLPLGTKWRR